MYYKYRGKKIRFYTCYVMFVSFFTPVGCSNYVILRTNIILFSFYRFFLFLGDYTILDLFLKIFLEETLNMFSIVELFVH